MLPETSIGTARNFEVMSDEFNVVGICSGDNYGHKWVTEFHKY